jgi:probable F420-dependent oxidoreductase
MRFAIGLPTTHVDPPHEFLTGTAIGEMATHVETLGFEAVYVTDHPAGDQQWLDTGGHHALDPFIALSFAAAATTRLRVQTHILVLPYRNPFLTAKSVLSLDALSGGRLTLGVAAGYLRSEFNALGVDYDERNDLFDEALDVVGLALTEDRVAYTGRHFRSRGTTMRPRPVQQPHPPIWIGGNSTRAMRRAVEAAQGWCPFPNPAAASAATKTPKLETLEELAARIEQARAHAADIGRTEPFDICFSPMSLTMFGRGVDRGQLQDEIAALGELGVTQVPVEVHAPTRGEWLARAERLASDLTP